MQLKDIIDVVAIIVSPIVAVLIGQYLQNREKSRTDKKEILKALMVNRGLGWSIDSVKALNLIEIVFHDEDKVLSQWKKYYNKLCMENPAESELSDMKSEGDRLLKVMADSLGYKDKVTWDTIQKPYIPKGLTDNMLQQQQFQDAQLNAMNYVSAYVQKMGVKDTE